MYPLGPTLPDIPGRLPEIPCVWAAMDAARRERTYTVWRGNILSGMAGWEAGR